MSPSCRWALCIFFLAITFTSSHGRVHVNKGQVFLSPPTAAAAPPSLLSVQRAEGNALIALRAALRNHPAFQGFFLNPMDPNTQGMTQAKWAFEAEAGIPASLHVPCSAAQWAWVGCNLETKRVVSINLNGAYMAKVNTSWSQTTGNPLVGTIPWEKLAPLTELALFDIGFQVISGDLTGIGSLTKLENLTLSRNQIKGSIPDEITKLEKLVSLSADVNQLSGTLPPSISTMTNLANLVLGSNSLGGSFPAYLQPLKKLQYLDLSSNAIRGPLPDTWSTLTALTGLQLQFTAINGTVPPSWSGMKSLAHVSMASCGLTATYPSTLTTLTNMQTIWMYNNKMYGALPANIFTDKLTQLWLDNNYFNGTIPRPSSNPNGPDQVDFRSDGNCFAGVTNGARPAAQCSAFYTSLYYTAPPPAPDTSSNTTIIIVAIVVPLVVVLSFIALAIYFLRYRSRSRLSKLFTKGLKQTSREFTLPELKQATKNWSNVIGKGGYGTVYKAELKEGSVVAVKRLDQVSKQGDVEFIREVELLSRVHHRHLVNLVGFCAERGERALVYEYMAMGSLYEHLHGESAKSFPLSWDSRCKIAIHVALGIEYLHYGADPPLIHRDIKSANILLSDDGYSKVADFGLCKEAPIGAAADGSEQLVPTATAVRGSFGYLDPEYVNTSILSEKSDVYSYGVVLLELISGHKSIHDWQPLAYWAEEYLADREKTPLMVDPALEGNFDLDELYALCDIARTCVQDQSVNRPTIRDVAKALVENLGHGMTSFTGSQQDSASIVPSSNTDASSMPSTTYTPSSNEASDQFSYQNYSETLHWTPNQSGQISTKSGAGLTVSTGTNGDRLPVPVPRKPKEAEEPSDDKDETD